MQDNVYGPPGADLTPPPPPESGFGALKLDRALNLAWAAMTRNPGLAVGLTALFFLLNLLSILTVAGIFLISPILHAGFLISTLMILRGKGDAGAIFNGFRRYGPVLFAAFLLWLISLATSLPFSAPSLQLTLRNFPLDRIGLDPWTTLIRIYIDNVATSSAKGFDPDRIWRTLLGYGNFPISAYLGGRFILIFPLIIERQYSAIEAMKTSWRVTGPFQWWLLLVAGIAGMILPMGVLACCVGLLFTVPFSYMIQAAAILQLLGEDVESETRIPHPRTLD